MSVEPTFQFNNKNENILVSDARADLFRAVNCILNRKAGLPNNPDTFFDIKRFFQEFGGDTAYAAIQQELENYLTSTLGISCSVEVKDSIETQGSKRKKLSIIITIGKAPDSTSIVVTGGITGDSLHIDSVYKNS